MDVSTTIKKFGLEQAFNYLYKDPDKNLIKIMDWADKFAGDQLVPQRKAIRESICISIQGGEPMVRKKDLIRLCEKHNDCIFLCFTNGTLIDEGFADDMLRVGNFIPAISLEGFEKATDQRRGKGVYEKATKTMKLLKEKKLLYGISACYTSANFESIT